MGIFQQFPYSNFHEMNLDEIIKIVKNMLEEWAQYYETWDNWKEQVTNEWSEMQSFINHYFDNLNVQTEINNKITAMVNSGEFSEIVDPYVPPAVSAWLAEHITTPETIVIDDSLTIEGAAADAKATGDGINKIKSDFTRDFEIVNKGKSPLLYQTVRNEYVKSSDGAFVTDNGWSRSDYMEVVGGETLSYYTSTTSSYNAFYDSNKVFISNKMMTAGTHSDGSYRTLDVPTNAKYFAISNSSSAYDATMIFRDNVLIDDTTASLSKVYSSQKIAKLMEDAPQILLPKECWAVVGTEFNIYYENVMICKDINEYYIYPFITPYTSITYNTYSDRLQIMPTEDIVGDYTLRLNIRSKLDWTNTITYKEMTLHIISQSALSNKRVIFIGDSLTNAGYYPYEIQEVLSAGEVQSLGTQVSNPWIDGIQRPIHHEGRGGWSAYNYVEESSMDGITNAFWNPNTSAFDFSYYMTQQGYSRPDIVFLNLGTNGASHIADNISAITEMITSIHAYDNTIPVCVSLITPPATQDGWTYSAPGGSAGQFVLAQMGLNSAYIENYDDVLSNVYVSPAYFNLDRYHDYPTAEFPVSARNPEIVIRQTNNVHPSKYGHLKLADVYWEMIQMLLG